MCSNPTKRYRQPPTHRINTLGLDEESLLSRFTLPMLQSDSYVHVMSDKKNTEYPLFHFLLVRHDCIFNLFSQPPRPKRQQAVVQGTLGVKLSYASGNPSPTNIVQKNFRVATPLVFSEPSRISTSSDVDTGRLLHDRGKERRRYRCLKKEKRS